MVLKAMAVMVTASGDAVHCAHMMCCGPCAYMANRQLSGGACCGGATMLKINFKMFFAHRVIFGFWVVRQPDTVPGGYNIRWDWNWQDGIYFTKKLPWHRCWVWCLQDGCLQDR